MNLGKLSSIVSIIGLPIGIVGTIIGFVGVMDNMSNPDKVATLIAVAIGFSIVTGCSITGLIYALFIKKRVKSITNDTLRSQTCDEKKRICSALGVNESLITQEIMTISKTLDSNDLEMFRKLCSICIGGCAERNGLTDSDLRFVAPIIDSTTILFAGMTESDIQRLADHGLVNYSEPVGFTIVESGTIGNTDEPPRVTVAGKIYVFSPSAIQIEIHRLTSKGRMISAICQHGDAPGFEQYIVRRFSESGGNVLSVSIIHEQK